MGVRGYPQVLKGLSTFGLFFLKIKRPMTTKVEERDRVIPIYFKIKEKLQEYSKISATPY